MKINSNALFSVTSTGDNTYAVHCGTRYLGGIVKWYLREKVNETGRVQFRHPWGDADSLGAAVDEFRKIGTRC